MSAGDRRSDRGPGPNGAALLEPGVEFLHYGPRVGLCLPSALHALDGLDALVVVWAGVSFRHGQQLVAGQAPFVNAGGIGDRICS